MRFPPIKSSVALAAVLLLSACQSEQQNDRYVGYIEVDWLYVAAPQSGSIAHSDIRRGAQVEQGQVLFELEKELQLAQLEEAKGRASQAQASANDVTKGARPAELKVLQAQLNQAKAGYDRAKSERDRVIPLVERDVESRIRGDQVTAEFERTKAAVVAAEEAINVAKLAGRQDVVLAASSAQRSADAAVNSAQWQLDQRTVRAPSEARVEDVFYKQGEFVNAGAPVLALYSPAELLVHFFVPEEQLLSLKIGQSISVAADGLADSLLANIVFIADTPEFTPPVIYSVGSREKLVFRVEAKFQNESTLPPGLPVDISIVPN